MELFDPEFFRYLPEEVLVEKQRYWAIALYRRDDGSFVDYLRRTALRREKRVIRLYKTFEQADAIIQEAHKEKEKQEEKPGQICPVERYRNISVRKGK